MIDYVCILAGGKGVRLHPLTFHIPKILVNLHNENILNKIINFWKPYCKKFVLIVNPEYLDFIDFYCKEHTDITYEFKTIPINNEENSYAIKHTLTDFDGKNLLITWCDVFPKQHIDETIFNDNIVFVNNFANYKSRYYADDKEQILEKVSDYNNGNVVGIYFIKNYKTLVNDHDKQDFCDCIVKNYGTFKTYNIELIDIGDKEKLTAYFNEEKHAFATRFFNRITYETKNTLKKESVCEYGDDIIKKEILFYNYIKENKIKYPFPQYTPLTDTSFLIEHIKEESVFSHLSQTHDPKVIFNLLTFVKNLYDTSPKKQISSENLLSDLQEETTVKIEKRYKHVEQILKNFQTIKYCNYIKIESYDVLQSKLKERIQHLIHKIDPSYTLIHGDLNLSNIFYTNPFTFIDPRGYYGKSKLFGLPYYDYAKIYFSLLGFDALNFEEKYFFSIEEDNIIPNINPLFKELPIFNNIFSDDEYELILCIAISIWLGLPFYFKDNLSKVVGSYFYARYLGTLYLNNVNELVKVKRAKQYFYYNEININKTSDDIQVLKDVKLKSFKYNTQPFTYKNKIIKKPWGFEFVGYETKKLALLCLHMKKNTSTSLHCHQKKDSSFIIAQGKVCVHTLNSQYYLSTGDTCFIQRETFHKIESLHENTIILEFEIKHPNRNDLYRYKDDYNREDRGYEGIQNMVSDITSDDCPEYFDFSLESRKTFEKLFEHSKILFEYDITYSKASDIYVVLHGYIVIDGKYYSTGSFLRGTDVYKKIINTYKDFCCLHFSYLS